MFRITKKIASTDDVKPINQSNLNFRNYFVYVLPNGMGKNRTELFRNAVVKNSGFLIDENKPIEINPNFKYLILFDENTIKTWNSLEKSLAKKSFFLSIKNDLVKNFIFLKSSWLSECLRIKKIVEIKSYELKTELQRESDCKNEQINNNQLKRPILTENDTQNKKKIRLNKIETDSYDSDEENQVSKWTKNFFDYDNESSYSEDEPFTIESNQELVNLESNRRTKFLLDNKTWTCAHSSKEQLENLNKHITDKLEKMSSVYENTREKYKALGYQKAILILKRHPLVIQSREEALALPGIGKRIAEKIAEIIQYGDIRKLNEMNSREDLNSLKMFTEIHGVGPTTAKLFISQGFRSLEDLRTKANLTKQQKIGLKFYDDFKQRIPREEVEKIEATVKEAALSLNNGLIVQTCGSYRRGKATCGDVDILITHPDKKSHKNIFTRLIHLLHEKNFLIDDLVVQEENADTICKYLGVCRLNEENSLNRRLDIIVVPYSEYACALLYFTGSAHFNRSMRHLASKLGLSLSEKSLNKNVIRKGKEKINVGEKIITNTEEDIFRILNIPYRMPEERDF